MEQDVGSSVSMQEGDQNFGESVPWIAWKDSTDWKTKYLHERLNFSMTQVEGMNSQVEGLNGQMAEFSTNFSMYIESILGPKLAELETIFFAGDRGYVHSQPC